MLASNRLKHAIISFIHTSASDYRMTNIHVFALLIYFLIDRKLRFTPPPDAKIFDNPSLKHTLDFR